MECWAAYSNGKCCREMFAVCCFKCLISFRLRVDMNNEMPVLKYRETCLKTKGAFLWDPLGKILIRILNS